MKINIVAEAMGVLGIIFSLFSFQRKSRQGILIMIIIAMIFFEAQAVLAGALTGIWLNAVSLIRVIIYSRRGIDKWASYNIWPVMFCMITLITGILSWQNVYSIAAIIGALLQVIALWMKDTKKLRAISFISGPFWFVYGIANATYASAFNELIAMTSIAIAMIRYDIPGKNTKSN